MATKDKSSNAPLKSSKRRRRAAVRQFAPNRSILLASNEGITSLPANEISETTVGWKAFGLSCLPPQWVPRFFVVDSSSIKDDAGFREMQRRISDCVTKLDLLHAPVLVRSSGTAETIERRGQLFSEKCASKDILTTIQTLSEKLPHDYLGRIYWIVQQHIHSLRKGHLSNERRLSREPRDFVAEFEPQGKYPGHMTSVAVRHWRDGDEVASFDLRCTSEPSVTLRLRRVALWAAALPSRVLFEWVWDGSRVWVVQADIARLPIGINPNTLRPENIPEISASSLKVFRLAGEEDFERYGKLRNARTYSELGYKMPTFYVLDDPAIVRQILAGKICQPLTDDLNNLTRRPLMIRTDGVEIPPEKREMLPRSEDLRTATQARDWLTHQFSGAVKESGIEKCSLCLIAHHFIPSIAAAWARSEPGNNTVRIESLWGLPEGLYWYSHDTFEVDTRNLKPTRRRLRFKGTFVAPNDDGEWVNYRATAPYDWRPSVSREEWLLEIARTTRRVAELEKHPVSMMWFVDNDPRATRHSVLPWYHMESAIDTPKAAPRRKLTTASDFKVETVAHWEELKSTVAAGTRIERVTLEPRDPRLIRNQEFARELADFAAENKIVIELAGGILSHAYHILRLRGTEVECIDLFGADEERIEYNKLVRDKIPELIERKGEGVSVVRLKGEALLTALRRKLVEESYEALDAKAGDELISELADIQEVIEGIRESLQVPSEVLEGERKKKRKRRGGFRQGLMLKTTSTPRTLARTSQEDRYPSLPTDETPNIELIEHASDLPTTRQYSRPDRRNLEPEQERLLTFGTELSRLDTAAQSTIFEMPISKTEERKFKLTIELVRDHSSLRSQVRLRLEPTQMSMDLPSDSQMQLQFPTASPPASPDGKKSD
jgi:predicted house-cleaning noncanonical NTP pyrophosphatase (MazG superfamily)